MEKLKTVMNLTMGLVYLILGAMIIQKQWFMTQLEPIFAWALGLVLILYGLLRLYRSFQSSKL